MDLSGWDFVCACSCDALNKLLAIQFKKTPATLSFDDKAGTTINAVFDPWRIVAGGSGKKLHIEIPVKTGTASTPLESGSIDGVVMVAEIELAFILDKPGAKSNLKFNFSVVASKPNDPAAGSVLIVTPDRDNRLPKNSDLPMVLHDNVPLCLIANSDKLSYLFTTLNLAPAGNAAWFTPKNTAYVYVQGTAGVSDYLAILGMITDVDSSKLDRKIDSSLCDGKNDVCIAFAPPVFLEHVIKPKLPGCYVGAIDASFAMRDFGIANIGPMIANVTPLICPPVHYGALDYTPVLTSLVVAVSGANVVSSGAGAFDITGLASSSVSFDETVRLKCAFDSASGLLTMVQDGLPVTNHNTHIPTWIYILAAPSLLFVGPLVIIIVDVIIAAVSAAIANSVSSNGGKLDLSNWSASAINFPGAGNWVIKEAGLSSAFYMRCMIT